jgi:citrate synthase
MSWLTAAEALQVLGVRPQTLYANVSRKKIRAKPDPRDPRRSLYHDTDVRKLARQQGGRRKTSLVASGAIEWGDPVLPSAISTVVDGRLYYRGQDAVELSSAATFEEVVSLLWSSPTLAFKYSNETTPANESDPLLRRAFLALGYRAAVDVSSYARALPVLQTEAAEVFATLVDALLGSSIAGLLHERVARTWQRPRAADMLRRVLVLLADHELNASTFATRVAVSTGAPLSAGVLSGLATLSGPLHGQAALGVSELVTAAERLGPSVAVRDWLAQGRHIVGFGHPLYPGGDPRATALLAELDLPSDFVELCEVVEQVIGEKPNIDFALAALTKVFRLPREAPLILFALARCAGWLAHALEQITTGHPIRPRARYVGPPPARS